MFKFYVNIGRGCDKLEGNMRARVVLEKKLDKNLILMNE